MDSMDTSSDGSPERRKPPSSPSARRRASATHRMPAEWERHAACLILYPHNPSVFRSVPPTATAPLPPHRCGPARAEVRNVARSIASCDDGRGPPEDVWILCNDGADAAELESLLEAESKDAEEKSAAARSAKEGKRGLVRVAVCPSDDSWIRDTGPTFLVPFSAGDGGDGAGLMGIDWNFNAYGGPEEGCYWPCDFDRAVARKILSGDVHPSLQATRRPVDDLVLEGGSIHVDGDGTVLTTAECLLNPNRNPHLTKEDIENIVLRELGATKLIWLPRGLDGDNDTNGHVDNFAGFVRPGEIVLSWTDDRENDGGNYDRCREALRVLEGEVDAKGRKLRVWKLLLPPPMYYTVEDVRGLRSDDDVVPRTARERLAASYANFYICNGGVIVPQFGNQDADERALDALRRIYPDRTVLGVPSREILLGGGNIHCITQQVPHITSILKSRSAG